MPVSHHTLPSARPDRRGLLCLLALLLTALAAPAQNILRLSQSADATTLSIRDWQTATITVNYACTSTSANATGPVVAVDLGPWLELASVQRSSHVRDVQTSGSTVRFLFHDLAAGTSGQFAFSARFRQTTPDATRVAIAPAFTATNATSVSATALQLAATNPPSSTGGSGTPTYSRGLFIDKWGPSSQSANDPWISYGIRHGTTGGPGDIAANYAIEDLFPPGTRLVNFATDRWHGTATPVTLRYRTNLNAAWRQWGSGPRYHTGNRTWVDASELALPSGERVTGLRWEYGSLDGAQFHPDQMDDSFYITLAVDAPGTTAGTTAPGTSPFGMALDFNGWIFESLSGIADSEGPLAVGGDMNVTSFGIGSRLTSFWDSRDTLIVGGTLTFNGGQLSRGNAVYRAVAVDNFTVAAGTKRQAAPPVDFPGERSRFASLSSAWAALPQTSGVSVSYGAGGTVALDAAGRDGLVVFQMDGSRLASASGIQLANVHSGATVLLNISGNTVQLSNAGVAINGTSGEPQPQDRVVWHFPQATSLTISSFSVPGMVFAPSAAVSLSNGHINGSVVARSLGGTGGGEIHWRPFIGDDLPNPGSSTGTATSRQNCADARADGLAARDCQDTTLSPPAPHFSHWTEQRGPDRIAIGETMRLRLHLTQYPDSSTDLTDPLLVLRLPPQFEFAGNVSIAGTDYDAAGRPAPVQQQLTDFPAAGETTLRWRWPAGRLRLRAIRDWNSLMLDCDIRVRSRTPNGRYDALSYASWTQPANTGADWMDTDTLDMDGDGSRTDRVALGVAEIRVETNNGLASLESVMWVKGELDSAWSRFPAVGETVPAGRADYELRVTNPSGIIMKNLTVIDILPFTGDRGVIDTSPRGSQWTPFLVAEVSAPPGVTVSYSTSSNPCRNELTPGLPAGCEPPNWRTTPPADITTVRSLKFDLTGIDLWPGDEVRLGWPMRAPFGAPTRGEVAWNSFGFIAVRADNNQPLLPSEPVKTGIAVRPPLPPFYGDKVWADTNQNGIQDAGETGLNGVRVDLFRDNGDGIPNPSTDTFVTFSATYTENGEPGKYLFGNIGAGRYFAVVTAPTDMGVAPQNAGSDDRKDADGSPGLYRGRRAAIMPVTTLTDLEEDRSWDQGFYDRSGIPAVWAMVTMPDDRVLLGGKFTRSHGTPRRNIARVLSDGRVDISFTPGTGFDLPVRSLAIRSDGLIWAGGEFTSFNGQPAVGVALLRGNGNLAGATAMPNANRVNWVATTSNRMYAAGAFSRVGTSACGNVARFLYDGSVDTAFLAAGSGAAGEVFDGSVLADGSVILVGAFSSFHGQPRAGIVKLKADGTVDATFAPRGGPNGEVYSVKVLDDGRMVLTGSFTSFAGVSCNGTVRLRSNGDVDPTMQRADLNVSSINAAN